MLEYEDLEVRVAASGGEAITIYSEFQPHLVFLDVKMAGLDGLETLTRLRDLDRRAQIVMISGHGTIATAVEATQRGAFDFLEKPLDTDRLLVTVRNALAHAELVGENARLREASESRYQMVGDSPALQAVRELIAKVGPTAARVLITGENGTGKELVARALHEASPRRDRAFIEVNCAAIPSELIESELFGHMKGSFTGAFADRAGKFEQADGGTLFLDEIGRHVALRPGQAAAGAPGGRGHPDRRLASRSRSTSGCSRPPTRTCEDEIAEGRFREDLLYRLNVVPIEVPPLRDRLEDVPGAGGALRRAARRRAPEWPGRQFADGRDPPAAGAALARQHPRAAERGRAGADPRAGQDGHRRGRRPAASARPMARPREGGTGADVRDVQAGGRAELPRCSSSASTTGTSPRPRGR